MKDNVLKEPHQPRSWLANILFFPFGCLLQTPPIILVIIVIGALAGVLFFSGGSLNPFAVSPPDFKDYQINSNYTLVQRKDGAYWTISYEKLNYTTFSGLVRHASAIRNGDFALLTHDILITSGDFANPKIVRTSVYDHHFTWVSSVSEHPQGTINLLHTVPLNDAIYQQLIKVNNGQKVAISGAEILRIDAYKPDGKLISYWQDSGCNTLVVTSVEILAGN
jgi:hypothetical protein